MIADDEGIVIESVSILIEKNFGDTCLIKSAKTGRSVIELAGEFRPDIIFMDIQMPGINGIDAMKEIKKMDSSIIFIVMSAYDKFNYAKEAINLGVLDYLMKPTNKNKVISTLERAMRIVDEEKERRSRELLIKEKLETVIPIIENGMIYSILFKEENTKDKDNFKELLGISESIGYMMVIRYGDLNENGNLTNPVGVSVKAQSFYPILREITKEFFKAVIGPIMVNQVVAFVPWDKSEMEYNERIIIIENARKLIRKLKNHIDVDFSIGIGSVKSLEELSASYKEAIIAIKQNRGKVVHFNDIPTDIQYENNHPEEAEKILLHLIKKGDVIRARVEADSYFEWLLANCNKNKLDIQTKVFELMIHIEEEAYSIGVKVYSFNNRGNYLKLMIELNDIAELKTWFLEKISEVCTNIITYKEVQSNTIIKKAKEYIINYFHKDISLDDVSREVDISPYYFSKLFKDDTGENFIDYLTNIRIEKAKELLLNKELSIKEIGIKVGYSDPNYFSRIFKKCINKTPTEYREGII